MPRNKPLCWWLLPMPRPIILAEVKKQDAASVKVFLRAGVEIANMSPEDFAASRAIAQETSYKKFVSDVPDGQALLDMALAVDEALEK